MSAATDSAATDGSAADGGAADNSTTDSGAAVSGATDQPLTYETAAVRIEEIIHRLDSGEATLNETVALVGEGKQLIEFCAQELESVSGTLQELRLDELVARLERGPGEGGAGDGGAASKPTEAQ